MTVRTTVFWDVMPCSLWDVYHSSTLMMEAAVSSEMPLHFHKTTHNHHPKGSNLHVFCTVISASPSCQVHCYVTESEIFLICSALILGVRSLEQLSIVELPSSGPLCLILWTNFYFIFILCLFEGKLYLYSTQISSIEFLYAIAHDDDVYTITEYTKKTRNVYVGVPGIHHYAINILWTMCVVHSKSSQVVMLHSCVWEVPGLNLGTRFPDWSLLYSCCHSRQIPVLYFQLGQDSFFQPLPVHYSLSCIRLILRNQSY